MAFLPFVVAVLAGLAIGLLRGGRMSALQRVRIHAPIFVIVAIGSGIALDYYSVPFASLIAVVGIAAGVGLSLRNIHLAGMGVVSIGIIANLLPVVFNGAVPVRADALVEAKVVQPSELPRVSLSGSRELADDSTVLAVLGDTIPVTRTRQVVSYGDLILLVGLADVIANAMRRRRRRRPVVMNGGFGWIAPGLDSGHDEAMTTANPDHDWGTAPSARPESPFQYSARPDTAAPFTIDPATSSAIRDSSSEPVLDSATQNR